MKKYLTERRKREGIDVSEVPIEGELTGIVSHLRSFGPCPECDKPLFVATNPVPLMLHDMPACDRFLREEIQDFAVWCNQVRDAQLRSAPDGEH